MSLTRRSLLGGSALLVAARGGPPALAAAAAPEPAAAAPAQPLVLCWNENPYGPGPAARRALQASIASACRYPDEEIEALVADLAAHEQVEPAQIVTGTGSGELLRALGAIAARGGGEIVAAQPTYLELIDYAQQCGASLRWVPVDADLQHDLAAMRAAVSERTRAVYLCNPNNPTGTALPLPRIRAFVESLPQQVTAIIDEAYMDFADLPGVASAAGLVAPGRRVVVLRTFSKIHGMAGVRCGYAIGNRELIAELASARMSSGSMLAARAARASLGDRGFLADTRRRILASRREITHTLTRLGHRYAQPQTNFVFFDTGMPLERFQQLMRERGILVGRRFPPYDTWCRITIGTEPQVQAFLAALPAVLEAGTRKG